MSKARQRDRKKRNKSGGGSSTATTGKFFRAAPSPEQNAYLELRAKLVEPYENEHWDDNGQNAGSLILASLFDLAFRWDEKAGGSVVAVSVAEVISRCLDEIADTSRLAEFDLKAAVNALVSGGFIQREDEMISFG